MGRTEFDYIIVGQGLAGATLSYQLMKAGKEVLVIDDNQPHTSSKVAAGLYNPITGRKMVKTWMADELFPYLISFYKELEVRCSKKFLVEMPIYRPFVSLEEQNEWMGKSASNEYNTFVKEVHHLPRYPFATDKYGGIELQQSGYLNTPVFLSAYRAYLEGKGRLLAEVFDIASFSLGKGSVSYNDYHARRIVFCDGIEALKNEYFNWLPFRPVKGEVLQVESDMPLDNILNRGIFIIPLGDGRFKIGSNYDNNDLTTQITEKAKHEIEKKLNTLINIPYEVVKQEAGIRPATKDRRPFIGLHPEYETIGVFNGLGTKGVSLAPYYSQHFVNFLEYGEEIHPDVNISRYFSLH